MVARMADLRWLAPVDLESAFSLIASPYDLDKADALLGTVDLLPLSLPGGAMIVLDKTESLPYTLAEALWVLNDVVGDETTIMALYQSHFPEQWARSTAAIELHDDQLYCDREWEFFQLVSDNLFPLNYGFLEDGPLNWVEGAEERSNQVQVECGWFGFEWSEIGLADMDASWKLLLVLTGEISGDGVDWRETEVRHDLPPSVYRRATRAAFPWDQMSGQQWELTCRVNGAPECLLALADAVRMIRHDTDTFFLDFFDGAEIDFPWEENTITYLTEDWRKAQEIMRRVDALRDWIEIPANAKTLISLYREAVRVMRRGGYPLHVVLNARAAAA